MLKTDRFNGLDEMQEFRGKFGEIVRTGGIGPENALELVPVFLGMEVGRYSGKEWGYIFGKNSDGSFAILVPGNCMANETLAESYATIHTRCTWDDHFNAYMAYGDCVMIRDGEIL